MDCSFLSLFLNNKLRITLAYNGNSSAVTYDKLYSPQMVVTSNTTRYTIENDLTKKRKKEETIMWANAQPDGRPAEYR